MSTVRTSINRLLRLADLLRGLKREEFDIGTWAEDCVHGGCVSGEKLRCGMVGCIGGWATVIHPQLVIMEGVIYNRKTGARDHAAFADAFGLDPDEAYDLTMYGQYKSRNGSVINITSQHSAARAVENIAVRMAKENGYEIVDS